MSSRMRNQRKYLVFQASEELYGIKVEYVNEVHKPEKILKLPRTSKVLSGIINLRGYILSVFNFKNLLWGEEDITNKGLSELNNAPIVLVVTIDNQQLGILADEINQLVDVVEVVDASEDDFRGRKLLNTKIGIKIGILENGKRAFLVDLKHTFSEYLSGEQISEEMKIDEEDEEFDFDQYTLAEE